MKHSISEDQIEKYQRDGYLVIEGFLDAGELEKWRAVTEDAVARRLEERGLQTPTNKKDDYYSNVFLQCLRLADTHEGMAELMYDPRLGEVAGRLAGADGIRIWHDQALIKPPYGNPTSWHLDNPYWSFHSDKSISMWVALDDATLANGCMWYLPGTHRTATTENPDIGGNMGDLFKAYPQWKSIEAVAGPVPAGSAVYHNGLVAHAAGANMTPRPRRAMTCAYMPEGAVFNGRRSILPEEYFKSLKVGDPLNNDAVNRLIWSRS